jgi:ELWxxDGT repeat protein
MELTNFKNTLFFTANDGTHGRELWKSNGTTAGTVLVKDVTPGAWGGVRFLEVTDDSLFFANSITFSAGSSHAYWRSNGTEAGTTLVTEIEGFDLTAYKGDVYFIDGYAGDPPNSTRLMKVGPGTGGVITVKQLRTDYGPGYGGVYFLREHNVFLYTASGALLRDEECCLEYKLWKSDGTAAGTTAINLPNNHRTSRMIANRFEGQYFYFTISDFHLTPEFPFFHYRTHLGTGETVLLGNTRYDDETLTRTAGAAGPSAEVATAGNASVTINGYRFLAASDVIHGTELWKEPAVAQNGFRLNAGGAAYVTTGGRLFAADAYFTGGRRSTAVSGVVDDTVDDTLYRVGRVGESFSYNLPLGNGTYDVVLYFNETY